MRKHFKNNNFNMIYLHVKGTDNVGTYAILNEVVSITDVVFTVMFYI